jgi:PhzF family phenazine biosynthesis protein
VTGAGDTGDHGPEIVEPAVGWVVSRLARSGQTSPLVRRFSQVDVFATEPYRGNPVAVVHDAAGIDDEAMLLFANWTNLSETTYLLPPSSPTADYRLRIFTPVSELPFAGHPTLRSCHAWLEAGGRPRDPKLIVQECGSGLIRIRRSGDGILAFAEPPLIREGPVDDPVLDRIADVLHLPRAAIVASQWVDNGPGWVAVLLSSAAEVLAIEPGFVDLDLGVIGPHPRSGRSSRSTVRPSRTRSRAA